MIAGQNTVSVLGHDVAEQTESPFSAYGHEIMAGA